MLYNISSQNTHTLNRVNLECLLSHVIEKHSKMSYLWSQEEIDAHRNIPFSEEEIIERSALRHTEYSKKCNDMDVDMSLFGVKDLGKMNLHELASIYALVYKETTADNLIEDGFVCFSSDGPEQDRLYYSTTALEKCEFMKMNHNHKYQVSIEIAYEYKSKKYLTFKQRYALNLFIDGELMTNLTCPYNWHAIFLCYNDSESIITNINKRANLKHWKLNITKTTEELMRVVMHPRRLVRHLELGGEPEDF